MKKHWYKRISVILAALLLLVILPMSAMAEKGTDGKTVSGAAPVKASASNVSRKVATPSNAERDEELADGELENDLDEEETEDDLPKLEDGESALVNDLKPEETTMISEAKTTTLTETVTDPTAVPAPEKPWEEQLSGKWAADEATVYRFYEDGTGALILPKHTYEFEYAIEDDELVLRFEKAGIGKVVFLFTLEEDTLLLEHAEGGFGEVLLERTSG